MHNSHTPCHLYHARDHSLGTICFTENLSIKQAYYSNKSRFSFYCNGVFLSLATLPVVSTTMLANSAPHNRASTLGQFSPPNLMQPEVSRLTPKALYWPMRLTHDHERTIEFLGHSNIHPPPWLRSKTTIPQYLSWSNVEALSTHLLWTLENNQAWVLASKYCHGTHRVHRTVAVAVTVTSWWPSILIARYGRLWNGTGCAFRSPHLRYYVHVRRSRSANSFVRHGRISRQFAQTFSARTEATSHRIASSYTWHSF